MAYTPTLKDLEEWEAKQAIKTAHPAQSQNSFDKVADWTDRYINKGIGDPARALTAGIAQGAEHGLASLANLIPGVHAPYVDLEKYIEPDQISRAAFTGGKLGGEYGLGGGLYGKGAKLLTKAPSLAKNMALGAGIGFGTGAHEEGDVFGRLLNGLIEGVAPGVSGLRNTSIANKIVNRQEGLKKGFEKEYGDIFKEIESKSGEKLLRVPEKLTSERTLDIFKEIPAKQKRVIQDFVKDPTFKNAHEAQSQLGEVIRKIKAKNPNSLTPRDWEALDLSKELQKRIKGSQQSFLTGNKMPDVIKKYEDVTKRYSKEYVPYKPREIKDFKKGETSAKKLVEALQANRNKTGNLNYYNEIPGFGVRHQLKDMSPLAKTLGVGGLAGAGTGLAYEFGAPEIADFIRMISE